MLTMVQSGGEEFKERDHIFAAALLTLSLSILSNSIRDYIIKALYIIINNLPKDLEAIAFPVKEVNSI